MKRALLLFTLVACGPSTTPPVATENAARPPGPLTLSLDGSWSVDEGWGESATLDETGRYTFEDDTSDGAQSLFRRCEGQLADAATLLAPFREEPLRPWDEDVGPTTDHVFEVEQDGAIHGRFSVELRMPDRSLRLPLAREREDLRAPIVAVLRALRADATAAGCEPRPRAF
ncbi:MAG: hypothetical protein H6721_14055 [Sandaracinus sp.]|nr:hypothetical protein [Myxococcales bacterium]MCB9611256.1 hypothetical protein [Sandaracinus sp.]MCB9633241.1 hypothetical protein [Sandaracinus sp.]